MSCQDRVACECSANGCFVAAVADGAGSADRGGRGAEIAVNTVIAHLVAGVQGRSDLTVLLREAAERARAAIAVEAEQERTSIRSYASTILAIILAPAGGAAMQLGDGVIVVDDGEEWNWVFWPQRGEYANATHFLTDDDSLQKLEVESLPGRIVDVSLMSDGLQPLALNYADETVHNPFFRGVFKPLVAASGFGRLGDMSNSLEDFLSSDRVASRTDDDLTLVLATRRA